MLHFNPHGDKFYTTLAPSSADTISSKQKLVHLDLKGAPPKLSYIKELMALVKEHGATGLLVEWEDTFPFTEPLLHLQRQPYVPLAFDHCAVPVTSPQPSCYSEAEVGELLQCAASHELEVVPLVQTFGHLEFVLKHRQQQSLRESGHHPNTLCPRLPGSMQLVQRLVGQVLALHHGARYLHLGMDEVSMGVCERCKDSPKESIFLEWVSKVCSWLKQAHPTVTPIIWDDMIRLMPLDTLKASGVGEMTDLMLWKYGAEPVTFPEGYLERVCSVFSGRGVWAATAYKGATGASQSLVPAQYHINNHIAWIRLLEQNTKFKEILRGFALTGWQRYDHMSIMCELLPVAVPCLVLCLSVLRSGEFTVPIHTAVSKRLGFKQLVDLDPCIRRYRPQQVEELPQFPGHGVYSALQQWTYCTAVNDLHMHSHVAEGWLHKHCRRKRFVSPGVLEMVHQQLLMLMPEFEGAEKNLRESLSLVFDQHTVQEWLDCFVLPVREKFHGQMKSCESLATLETASCSANCPCVTDAFTQETS